MGLRHRIAALAIAVSLAASTPVRADDAGPIDLATVPAALRATLPAATIVKLPTAQEVTLGSLLDAHAARLARIAANAPPLPLPTATREAIGANFVYLGGGNDVVPAFRTPPPVPVRRVRLELVATAYVDRGWAASYVNFCSRSQASVCLYEPGHTVFTLNYPSTGTMSELDPFFDDDACATAGGVEIGGYCTFIYPMSATVKFDPGDPSVAQREGSCASDFIGKIEPKGIVTIAYDPKSYESDAAENALFTVQRACVIRVYEPPPPKKRPLRRPRA